MSQTDNGGANRRKRLSSKESIAFIGPYLIWQSQFSSVLNSRSSNSFLAGKEAKGRMSRKAAPSLINSIYGERKEFSINLVLPPYIRHGQRCYDNKQNAIFFPNSPSHPLRIGTEIVVRDTLKETESLSFRHLVC
ncbi:hypothetical protein CDAR_429441 [Caerostris darwini]|uniref:Uncharacterized protein n=1 Tax=Caerostris darwini TaxID=1538125 RepID=A0AAV4WJ05_9ARAC|nr:hypothetical protein CDAR_429441 [Caerostris darwini]